MISLLIALSLLLAAIVVWFLARPLTRGSHAESREEHHQLQFVRERLIAQLNELDIEVSDSNMDASTAAEERVRLESELAQVLKRLDTLLPDVVSLEKESMPADILWRWVLVMLIVIVPGLTIGVYAVNVSVAPWKLQQVAAEQPAPAAPNGAPDPMQMVARLEKRLQEDPNNPEGWLRLGRSYVVLGRFDDATTAYDRAYQQLPKTFVPENADALWFVGLAAFNHGDNKRALALWNSLLAKLPPDSQPAKQLRSAMEQAKKKMK